MCEIEVVVDSVMRILIDSLVPIAGLGMGMVVRGGVFVPEPLSIARMQAIDNGNIS